MYSEIYNIKYMKKLVVILVITFTLGVLLTACRQTQQCPAYGEYKQYQRESVY